MGKLLVYSMLFHAALAMASLPMQLVFFISIFLDKEKSYVVNMAAYLGIFALLLLRDYIIFKRTQPNVYLLQELILMAAFPVLYYLQSVTFTLVTPTALFYPWAGLVVVMTLSPMVYFFFFAVSVCVAKFRRRGQVHNSPTRPTGIISFFCGHRRSPQERTEFYRDTRNITLSNTIFRKYCFEPVIFAVARGLVAIYCCIGLFVFAIYSILLLSQTGSSVTQTLINLSDLSVPYNYSVTIVPMALPDGHTPTFSVSMDSTCALDSAKSGDQFQTWECTQQDFTPTFPSLIISSLDSATIAWWILLDTSLNPSDFTSPSDIPQIQYTTPLLFAPNTIVNMTYTVMQTKVGKNDWFSLTQGAVFPDLSGTVPTNSFANISWNPLQSTVIHQEIVTGFKEVLQVLGTVGGILSFIDLFFSFVFGRALIATVTGGRLISPFGMMGLVARDKLKAMIRKEYPDLQRDLSQRGLGAYVREVALDADFLVDEESAPIAKF